MMIGVNRRSWLSFTIPALLGLPAAVLAHAEIFGGRHLLGGGSHALVWALCAASSVAAIVAGSRMAAERIRAHVPSAAQLLLSAGSWFVAIELCEQPHAIPLAQAVALLCAAALAIGITWRCFTRAAEFIASELSHKLGVAVRDAVAQLYASAEPIAVAHAPSYRLFSRPPPA